MEPLSGLCCTQRVAPSNKVPHKLADGAILQLPVMKNGSGLRSLRFLKFFLGEYDPSDP